jgi:hypothetical protein
MLCRWVKGGASLTKEVAIPAALFIISRRKSWSSPDVL